jgi:hypothetical protein
MTGIKTTSEEAVVKALGSRGVLTSAEIVSATPASAQLLDCMERSSRGARSGGRASRLGPFVSRLRR